MEELLKLREGMKIILLQTEENISVKALSKDEFEGQRNFSFLRNVISEGVKVV